MIYSQRLCQHIHMGPLIQKRRKRRGSKRAESIKLWLQLHLIKQYRRNRWVQVEVSRKKKLNMLKLYSFIEMKNFHLKERNIPRVLNLFLTPIELKLSSEEKKWGLKPQIITISNENLTKCTRLKHLILIKKRDSVPQH